MVLTNNIESFSSRGCRFSSSSKVHNVSNNLIYKWKQQSWKHSSLKVAKPFSWWNLFLPQSRWRFDQSPDLFTTGNLVLLCIREQLHSANDFHFLVSFSCFPSPAFFSFSFSFFSFWWLTTGGLGSPRSSEVCGRTAVDEHRLAPGREGTEWLRWCSRCPLHLWEPCHHCPQQPHCGTAPLCVPSLCSSLGQWTGQCAGQCDMSRGLKKLSIEECMWDNVYLEFFESSHTFLRPLLSKFKSQHWELRPKPSIVFLGWCRYFHREFNFHSEVFPWWVQSNPESSHQVIISFLLPQPLSYLPHFSLFLISFPFENAYFVIKKGKKKKQILTVQWESSCGIGDVSLSHSVTF